MRNLNLEVEKEIKSGQFNHLIKDTCQWCGIEIPGTLEHYIDYGNCCAKCSALFTNFLTGKKDKNGYKERNWTQEEKKEMFSKII